MDDIFVARLMSSTLYKANRDTLVEDAAQTMLDGDVGAVLVVDENDHIEGILTSTDFVGIVAESHPKAQTSVERYMTEDVVTTTAQVPIRDAADLMIQHGVHHLPVVDEEDRVIGMLSTRDIASYLSSEETPSP